MKLSGAIFSQSHCTAPWCLRTPHASELAPYLGGGAASVIEFHFVIAGRGYVRTDGETVTFGGGDVLLLPHGDAHDLGNGRDAPVTEGRQALPLMLTGRMMLADFGGGGEETRFVCGYLRCDEALVRPVLAGMPRILRVNLRGDARGEWLEQAILHAAGETRSAVPGAEVILARLAEVLFAETLRRHLLSLPPERTGWLAGAGDAVVGRSLAELHRRPSHGWTLEALAQVVGTSRSVLTERFARYLGQGPMAYLAEWRLELAADALRSSSRSVQRIALDVGYDSEAAFNRAFKRRFRNPPARYRRLNRESGVGN